MSANDCWKCLGNGWYWVARLDEKAEWIGAKKPCSRCNMKPEDWTAEFVIANPIPARCKKCGAKWIDGNGNGAIRAPGLSNAACFYCHGKLVEIEVEAPAVKLKSATASQPGLFE